VTNAGRYLLTDMVDDAIESDSNLRIDAQDKFHFI
jgi:hypothetical protein